MGGRRGPGCRARRAAGRRPGYVAGPGHGAAWTTLSAPPGSPRPSPAAPSWTAAPRPPPTARRSGRSCSCHQPAAAAPGTPASAERPGPARRRRRAAGPAAGPGRRRPPPPRSAPASPLPTPPASPPDRPMRGPAPRLAAPPPGRSPPPCAWPYAGPHRSSLLSWHAPSRSPGEWRTWRACLITDLLTLAPLLSHATARTGRLAPRYKARPHAVGRRFGSQPVGPHERYGTTAAPSGTIRRFVANPRAYGW